MMKKAIVIGGSNGMGLAISRQLIDRGYFLEICDRVAPEEAVLEEGKFRFTFCNLLELDEGLLQSLAQDPEVEVLMVTAGIGRVADFQFHHTAEIKKILQIDAVATLQIFRIFYERILGEKDFFAGVMGSISGWMSSPSTAVYAAAKAAVVRFVESVNIELEANGSPNRILDVSPGFFGGSRFYGQENQLPVLEPLAGEIVQRLFARDTLFIPQYDAVYQDVLERYHQDSHGYGLHSYQYKKDSGRLDNQKRVVIGYLSGTFDLFHVGHLNLIRRAKQQCDYLIVGVHDSGKWKGKETFISLEERKAIVGACRYVNQVVDACVEDSQAWELYHFDRLFVGSDYKGTERFQRYEEFFKEKHVEIVYFPYTQSTSSTIIRQAVMDDTQDRAEKE